MTVFDICHICNEKVNKLPYHIRTHNINAKNYYDKYFKEDNEGICHICSSDTKFKSLVEGYQKYCSCSCREQDVEFVVERETKHRETLKNNPDIIKEQVRKFKKAIKSNPIIIEDRIRSFKETLKNNPDIQERINAGISLWAKENPEKTREKSLKGAQTIKDNPIKYHEKCKNISIGLRNGHNLRSAPNSSVSHFLYIIKHLTKPIIKIGRTDNPKKRLYGIISDFGVSEIIQVLKGTYEEIKPLEIYLHDYFNEYCEVQPSGAGRTEWFNECILEETIDILSRRS